MASVRRRNLRAKGVTPKQLVDRVGSSYSFWSDLLRDDEKSFGEKVARRIEVAFEWPDGDLDRLDEEEALVAQTVSERLPIVPPRTIVWEDLVSEKIEGQFLMAIVGDALAPDYLPGQMGIWQAGDAAKNGQPVLIRLPEDQFELRIYEGRGKTWAGVSERKGHRPLSPEDDGAQIVARLRYVDLD